MYIGQTLQPHFPQAQLEITTLYLQIVQENVDTDVSLVIRQDSPTHIP